MDRDPTQASSTEQPHKININEEGVHIVRNLLHHHKQMRDLMAPIIMLAQQLHSSGSVLGRE